MRDVVLYTRARCCLCDEALAVIERAGQRVDFQLSIVDIDGDPALVAAYGDTVPVVTVDGRMHAKYRVDEEAFVRRLGGGDGAAA